MRHYTETEARERLNRAPLNSVLHDLKSPPHLPKTQRDLTETFLHTEHKMLGELNGAAKTNP